MSSVGCNRKKVTLIRGVSGAARVDTEIERTFGGLKRTGHQE